MHPEDETPETTPDVSRVDAPVSDTSATPEPVEMGEIPAATPGVGDASDTPPAASDTTPEPLGDAGDTSHLEDAPVSDVASSDDGEPDAPLAETSTREQTPTPIGDTPPSTRFDVTPEALGDDPAVQPPPGDAAREELDDERLEAFEEAAEVDPWEDGKPRVDADTGMLLPVPPEVPEQTRADRDLQEVHDVLRERNFQADVAGRTESRETLKGIADPVTGDPGGSIEIRTVDRRLYITVEGEAVFDPQGCIQLRRALEAAFSKVG